MDIICMNSGNSKTSDPHRLLLNPSVFNDYGLYLEIPENIYDIIKIVLHTCIF